ncbi:MAG: hypothetical protein ACFE9L_13850 [Candidatus Hodarchaeota archaeon]
MKGSKRIFSSSFLFMIIIFLRSPIIFSSPSINIHPSLGEPFYIIEVGDSNNINPSSLLIEKLASISIPGMLSGIQVVIKIAYIGDHSHGLKIYNMSNPENPSLIGSSDLPGIYHDLYVDVDRELAYLADLEDGLEILDISILSNPIHVVNYSVGEQNIRYIYAFNNLLFSAN